MPTVPELVPRRAIAAVARRLYNENYLALPMDHRMAAEGDGHAVEYRWRHAGAWHGIHLTTTGTAALPAAGSEEEFVTEHYWGYVRQRDGSTLEHQVERSRARRSSREARRWWCGAVSGSSRERGWTYLGVRGGRMPMAFLADSIRFLAAAALGVYLGAMLTEGFVLVPWWRSLAPEEFLRWYAANDQRLVGFFGPVTSAATLLAVAATALSFWEGHPGRVATLIPAAIMVALVVSFFVYFEPANQSFAKATVAAADLPAALATWGFWHHTRTALAALAFAASLAAIWRT